MSHRPRKRFGQHFLHDDAVAERIVRAVAPRPGQHLVEIGPGLGALTRPLLGHVDALDVIELDRDLAARLERELAPAGRLTVHAADALRFDFTTFAGLGRRLRVVGNLPYNISTPLLFHLLAHARVIDDMHFLLQREVVERIVARPGSRAYGRLSVMLGLWCTSEKLFSVGPGAFRPPPKVTSSLVRLTVRRAAAVRVADAHTFAELVARLFSQRRKTLRNGLGGALSDEELRGLGIDPQARAETLDLEAFARLANAVHRRRAAESPRR